MLLFAVVTVAAVLYTVFGHMIWSRIIWNRITTNSEYEFRQVHKCAFYNRGYYAFLWVSFVSVWPAWMVVGFIRAKWQDHLDHMAAHA